VSGWVLIWYLNANIMFANLGTYEGRVACESAKARLATTYRVNQDQFICLPQSKDARP
jgi:hypothetical protein